MPYFFNVLIKPIGFPIPLKLNTCVFVPIKIWNSYSPLNMIFGLYF